MADTSHPLHYSAEAVGETHLIPGLWLWHSFGCTSFAWDALFKVLQPGGGLKDELMWLRRAGPQHMPSSPAQPGLQGAQSQHDWGAGAGRQTWQMALGLALLSQPGALLGIPAAQHIWRAVCSPVPSWTPLRCSREVWQRHELRPCHCPSPKRCWQVTVGTIPPLAARPVLSTLLLHTPCSRRAVGAHGCEDNAIHPPGSSQGVQDKCQPRHGLEDRQAPHRAAVMWPCIQHPICHTWWAVPEAHQRSSPHAQVFQMQRTRCFP